MLHTYNLKEVICVINGVPLSGWGENDAVTITADEDDWTKTTGADGEVTRSRTNNQGGTFEFTVMQTSDSNDVLGAAMLADRLTGTGIFSVLIKDLNSRSEYFGERCWIRGPAEVSYGKEAGERTWTCDADVIVWKFGGAGTGLGGLPPI